jgi:SWI/SNF-related matrix-associated actin-dependent regulator of chromatin subfamily A protein 2/4
VYRGVPHQRKALQPVVLQAKFNVMVTTYDYIMKDRSVLGRVQWKYLVRLALWLCVRLFGVFEKKNF